MILLRLFILWDQFQSRILLYNTTLLLYLNLCWQIWLDVTPNLDEYLLYFTDNILQRRKSQVEVKLNQEHWCKAKKLATEAFLRELVKQEEIKDSA